VVEEASEEVEMVVIKEIMLDYLVILTLVVVEVVDLTLHLEVEMVDLV
jgi:hypothetical protein